MKPRTAQFCVLAGCALSVTFGCAHVIETQSIHRFTSALENRDLDELKSTTSENFDRKALRLEESVDDFRILRLPDGKISIVNVQDISEGEKLVTVEVGEKKRKLRYRLMRDPQGGKWLVDDIYVRKEKGGVVATKAVTEQMDLFLTVREFFEIWNSSASRSEVISLAAPRLESVLSELPPVYLARLTRQVSGEGLDKTKFRPVVKMDRDAAVVELPTGNGKMLLSMKLLDGSWKISDIAVEGRDEESRIPSVLKMAVAMNTATRFLDLYEIGDRQKLETICNPRLYRNSLQFANFAAVPLPNSTSMDVSYSIIMQGRRADFELQGRGEVIKISLTREDDEDDGELDSETLPVYLVEDVTIFDLQDMQQKKLSSLFTAQAVMQLYAEAFARRNLSMLKQTSTDDMNDRVWNKLEEYGFSGFPLPEFDTQIPVVETMEFNGAVVKLHARRGNRKLTYVLRDRGGEVRVDDVLASSTGRPESFKTTMDLLIPIRTFTAAIESAQIGLLQRNSSNDFNRLVWKHVPRIPSTAFAVRDFLREPMTSVDSVKSQMLVTLGDGHRGAEVTLVKEHDHYVVDEVRVIAGPQPEQRKLLKETLRIMLAEGIDQLDGNFTYSPQYRPQYSTGTGVSANSGHVDAYTPAGVDTVHPLQPISSEEVTAQKIEGQSRPNSLEDAAPIFIPPPVQTQ